MTTRMLQIAVLILTVAVLVFNYLSATGQINGRDAGEISRLYPTELTPAGYAFSIWSLIYLGTIAFSIYQALPGSTDNQHLRKIRPVYLVLCFANIGWIFSWHYEVIPLSMFLMVVLLASLASINVTLKGVEDKGDVWFVSIPFGIYFGWVTVATILNATILCLYLGLSIETNLESTVGVLLIAVAVALGTILRFKINSMAYPLAIAWGLTAIGVEQSGDTAVVLASALGMMALIFFAFWGFVKDR